MPKVSDYLSESDILLQLAEEAAELSAAAAKLARKLDGRNPTPKSEKDCWGALFEELADVDVCLAQIDPSEESIALIESIFDIKGKRWLKRLEQRSADNGE